MPTLIVEDIPGEIYERLQRQAQAEKRTLSEEAVRLLRQGLSAPESKTTKPAAEPEVAVSPRLPCPPILDTGEISPPCSLPRPGVGVPVPTQPGGARQPTRFVIVEAEDERNHV